MSPKKASGRIAAAPADTTRRDDHGLARQIDAKANPQSSEKQAQGTATPLAIALDYIGRGWNPLPIPFRTKRPVDDGWQKRVITEATAAAHFNSGPQNIGVVLGPSSHGLTDVDLDSPEAIALAPFVLPPTKAIFGRRSKPESPTLLHRLMRYRTADGDQIQ